MRMLTHDDVTAFTGYRNLDDVARYQDWPVPYTRDLAHELVDDIESLAGPTNGHWVQLALDADGTMVGDIAVWLDDAGELAMIGYTIAPRHQGHNYAVEAADRVIEWLFTKRRVHRIAATIDPRNMASARVLERCGFEYVGTARSSAFVRGEWTDDARFSLLADDWRAWRDRPTRPPGDIGFVDVTSANLDAVSHIDVAHSQRRFVTSVSRSIADATHPAVIDGVPVRPWYRAITADGELAGFAMLALATTTQPTPILWRLLVDQRHQRRGVARRAIGDLASMLIDWGDTHLDVSFVDEPGGPEAFYRLLGFERTGDTIGGETCARAALDTIVRRTGAADARP
ncbi:MAG: GNAT family N-acetyltransferase [Ilumatobacteraceae bacterium]